MVAYDAHPLDAVIGSDRCDPELIVRKLASSDDFMLMITLAVSEAELRLAGVAGGHFGTEVRRAISRQFQCNNGELTAARDDDLPSQTGNDCIQQDYPRLTPLG